LDTTKKSKLFEEGSAASPVGQSAHPRPKTQIDTTPTKNSGFKRTSKREKLIIIIFKNFRKTGHAPPKKPTLNLPTMNDRQNLL